LPIVHKWVNGIKIICSLQFVVFLQQFPFLNIFFHFINSKVIAWTVFFKRLYLFPYFASLSFYNKCIHLRYFYMKPPQNVISECAPAVQYDRILLSNRRLFRQNPQTILIYRCPFCHQFCFSWNKQQQLTKFTDSSQKILSYCGIYTT
jgi:hypothetical protein